MPVHLAGDPHNLFGAFTFAFERTQHGWFQMHAYQFSRDIVHGDRRDAARRPGRLQGWTGSTRERSIEFCESLFGGYLGGERLQSNARHLRGSAWLNFNRVLCRQWHSGNIVLIGDAAHTAHFGIGSGTKLAMEDAVSLVAQGRRRARRRAPGSRPIRPSAASRRCKLQSAARNRMEWFENVERYTHLPRCSSPIPC